MKSFRNSANGGDGLDWMPFVHQRGDFCMKRSKIFAGVAVAFPNVPLCTVAVGQDNATAQEVIAKVREAASALSKTGDLAQFNQKQGPWVWKDTYIFIQDKNSKERAHGESWIDYSDRSCSEVLNKFQRLASGTDFTKRGVELAIDSNRPDEKPGVRGVLRDRSRTD
jgi:hypothetical protein